MAIFDPLPRQPVLSDDVNWVKTSSLMLYEMLNNQHRMIFQKIWNNPNFTARQMIDAFGKDAVKLFATSSLIQQTLASVDSSYEPLVPPKVCTINEDGSVTVDA
jgi:hypothetical protein